MSYTNKINKIVADTYSNEGVVTSLSNAISDLTEVVKELKFQYNHAKQDPDKFAYEMQTAVEKEIMTAEGILKNLKKDLGMPVVAHLDPDDEEDDEEPEDDQPDEEDAFFAPSGYLGSKTSLSVGRKHLGEFNTEKDAEKALVDWINRNKFCPNIWHVSDHGNVSPYVLDKEIARKVKL